jgi:thioredoxin-disulfide reductase
MSSLFVLAIAILLSLTSARPLVREIRTDREFQRLLKHHKTETGLPVIVDYYSNGCGPCRQIAPHFKKLAKQYKNKVVFAKVNVDTNRETSGKQQIRSMPTFQAYLLGKKRKQFSGADIQSLQSIASQLSKESQKYQVEITDEGLKNYYLGIKDCPHSASEAKAAEQASKILEKTGTGGPSHYKMVQRLKKKYGVAPPTKSRDNDDKKKSANKKDKKSSKKKRNGKSNKPNLHLASIDELMNEIEMRREKEEEEKEANSTGTDDDMEEAAVAPYVASGETERVVIIGAGPAGLAAAVYAARAGLKPVVIAPLEGGQLQGKGVLVENFPGVSGITGPVIVFDMRKQAAQFGTRFLEEKVVSVDVTSGTPFRVVTESQEILAHTVILATGADSRWLDVDGEYSYRGGGVSSCATCDGFLYRDKPVVVIGGGDTAMEDALVLARTSSLVTILHRRDTFRASHILAQRVLEHPNIKVRWNTSVVGFEGTNTTDGEPILSHVLARDQNTNKIEQIQVDAAFVAIGHDPNTKYMKGTDLDMDTGGYLLTQPDTSKTSVPGIFAAGDVADRVYRQAITSAGSGAMAALDAERWLSESGVTFDIKLEVSASGANIKA